MVQKYKLFFIILMITIMVTAVHAQAQTMQSSVAGSASNAIASSENNVVKILVLDSVAFPKIKVNLFIIHRQILCYDWEPQDRRLQG
jgi:hypothetical protein